MGVVGFGDEVGVEGNWGEFDVVFLVIIGVVLDDDGVWEVGVEFGGY